MDENQTNQMDWRGYWDVLVRRRWLLLGILFAAGLVATAGAKLWPVRYQSEAEVLVQRQDVPSQYVRPNVVVSASEELASIKQRIESRTMLKGLIQRFDLYPRDRARLGDDRVVKEMRKDIDVRPVETGRGRELTAFYVEYTYGDPHIAQQVTSQLTSEFINDSLKSRTQASVATTDFLKTQLRYARQQMNQEDARLQDYQSKYLGELPEQQQNNLEALSSLEAQLYSERNARDRAKQQKIYLESLAAAYQSPDPAPTTGASASVAQSEPSSLASTDKAIADLKQKLIALEANFTSSYPDVVHARDQLKELEAVRRKEFSSSKAGGHAPAGAVIQTDSAVPNGANLAEVESRLKATTVEIRVHSRRVDQLRQQLNEVQKRLQLTPLREQQLTQVEQAYENARQQYQSLLKKKMQSELATDLEMQAQGERLSLIDPANLPHRPVSPNRLEIILAGWLVGLTMGVGLIAAKETADESLRVSADVRKLTGVPILAYVPVLRTTRDESLRKWLHVAEISAVVLLTLLLVALGTYVCLVR